MSNSLSVPPKVEYLVVKARRTSLGIKVATFVASAFAVGGLVYLHYLDPTPHKYNSIQIPSIGVDATLRTKWIDGSAHYVFRVKALPSNEVRLDDVLKTTPREEIRFTIRLLDKDGFEVCKGTPPLSYIMGPDGKFIGVEADQIFKDCDSKHFASASGWRLSHKFPSLTSDLDAKKSIDEPNAKQEAPATSVMNAPEEPAVSFDSELTGTDVYTGKVETLDRGSFQITRKAEYITLAGWRAPDNVHFICKKTICVVTNLRYGESVHASKSK